MLSLLKGATGVDFNHYKHSTIKRRIKRRMMLGQVTTLEDYLQHLRQNPEEVKRLYEDILINVTSFFREPEAFEALQKLVFPEILRKRALDDPIRIWVRAAPPGKRPTLWPSASWNSWGIWPVTSRSRYLPRISKMRSLQARLGFYPESIAPTSPRSGCGAFLPGSLAGYQVSKTIRGMCVFARQNLVKDPPFSRLDLISCRNVLIYFGAVLQKRRSHFPFCLEAYGFLLLGKSEALSAFPNSLAWWIRSSRST